MFQKLRRLLVGRRGAGKTEYIIVVLLIAIFTIAVVSLFGDNVRALFATQDNALAGNEGTTPVTKEYTGPCHYNLKGGVECTGGPGGAGGQPGESGGAPGSQGSGVGSSQSALTGGQGGSPGNPGDPGSGSPGSGTSGNGAPGETKKGSDTSAIQGGIKGKIYDGTKKKGWGNEDTSKDDPNKKKPIVTEITFAEKTLGEYKNELYKIGGEDNNIRFGALDASSKVAAKYDRDSKTFKAGMYNEFSASVVEANAKKKWGNENGNYGELGAQGRVLTVNGNADVNVIAGKEGFGVATEVGLDANVVEGKVKGEFRVKIPKKIPLIGGLQFRFGGNVSAQIGASVKGNLKAGLLPTEGGGKELTLKTGLKVALGPGVGFGIDIGISRPKN
jgi:Flp pilus assembly pilin Flp